MVRNTGRQARTNVLSFEIPGRTCVASHVSHHVHSLTQILKLSRVNLGHESRIRVQQSHARSITEIRLQGVAHPEEQQRRT